MSEEAKVQEDLKNRETQASEDGKNARKLVCPWCECVVLNPGVGVLIEREIQLPKPKRSDNAMDTIQKHWLICDHFQFENIGVTRAVSTDLKYLACADCELGPLGIVFLNDPSKYYIADSRVKYL